MTNLFTKIALAGIGTVGAIALMVEGAAYAGMIYPQTLEVNDVKHIMPDDCYVLTLSDVAGHEYHHTVDDGDMSQGDLVSVIMYANGTYDDVTDDDILALRYTGRCGNSVE